MPQKQKCIEEIESTLETYGIIFEDSSSLVSSFMKSRSCFENLTSEINDFINKDVGYLSFNVPTYYKDPDLRKNYDGTLEFHNIFFIESVLNKRFNTPITTDFLQSLTREFYKNNRI